MKAFLGWVILSRAEFAQHQKLVEDALARAERSTDLVARTVDALQAANARFDALMQQFTTLRVAGASSQIELHPSLPPARELDDIDRTFNAVMEGRPLFVQAAARRQLAADRAAVNAGFMTQEGLIQRILQGNPSDGVPD